MKINGRHRHESPWDIAPPWAVELGVMAQMIIERLDAMAHTLADTLAAVQDESTKVESLIALLAGLKAQLDAALAGALTPEQQAAVDAIFTAATSEAANIDAAITANTPPPAPAPAP